MQIKYILSLLIAGSLTMSALAMSPEAKTQEAPASTAWAMPAPTQSQIIMPGTPSGKMPTASEQRQREEGLTALRQQEEPFTY